MAVKVVKREGESLDDALRRFKQLCIKSGMVADAKKNRFYEKPSQVKRNKEIQRRRNMNRRKRTNRRPGR